MTRRKATVAPLAPLTEAQQTLREDLRGVRYLRLDTPDGVANAEALVRHGLVYLEHQVFTGKQMVACVARSRERKSAGQPPKPVKRYDNGTRVSITRHEHGWVDGAYSGVIVEPFGVDGYKVFDETTGSTYEVNRHRDVRPE